VPKPSKFLTPEVPETRQKMPETRQKSFKNTAEMCRKHGRKISKTRQKSFKNTAEKF
jgi:hypothetical protein